MSIYFVGDIHGCYKNLKTILNYVHFNPNIDTLYLTGDLVARGPDSLGVLRLIYSFNKSVRLVLGNHDLHLLKTYFELNYYKKNKSYFHSILFAPDSNKLLQWLRHQPLLHVDENKKIIMSHAGINPAWNIKQAKYYAQEIENILISDYPDILFQDISDLKLNTKKLNYINLNKLKKIQNNLNSFTRMRYVYSDGRLNLSYKLNPNQAPNNIYPWFNLPRLIHPTYSIIFGHWSSLNNTVVSTRIYCIDSGCCWGKFLTLLRWEDKKIIQIPCNPPS